MIDLSEPTPSIVPQSPLSKKTGVVLLNMGGPSNLDSVQPFLYNLFSDADIIKLPLSFLFQKPLAWFISTSREKEAQHNYSLMGGASPQLPLTQNQASALQEALRAKGYGQLPIYLAMRYWHPFTADTVKQMRTDGIEQVVVLTLYPHFSYTTTGSSLKEFRRQLMAANWQLPYSVVAGYAKYPPYLAAMADCIQQGLDEHPWDCPKEQVQILFSAHSLPVKHVKRTKDPYPDHIFASIKTIMAQYFPQQAWDLAYQSKVGNMPWLGPYTDSALSFYAAKLQDNILIVPISFVTDHVETLVEIDRQYIPQAKELGIRHCYRAPALNNHPGFINALAELVSERLERFLKQPA